MSYFSLKDNSFSHDDGDLEPEEDLIWTEHEIGRVDRNIDMLNEKLASYCTKKTRESIWERIDIQLDRRLNFMERRDALKRQIAENDFDGVVDE
jgi:hypothetical protein